MAFCRIALILSLLVYLVSPVLSQQKPAEAASALCTKDLAVDTTKQQILNTRTFDDLVHRITILLRAADLLWPHEQERALAAFTEAFELAVANYKEKGDQIKRASDSRFAAVIPIPDQRFKVLTALAKRDPARAQKLSEQMLKENAQELADKPAADDKSQRGTNEKLLGIANALISTDRNAAMSFARQSFKYPATLFLASFLYEFAKVDKGLADRFYTDALGAYAKSPMDQFLYLSAYPFGNTRDAGEMPGYTNYRVPEGYVPNVALQRAFMSVLLARAEGALSIEVSQAKNYRYPDHAQIWLALTRLEAQVQAQMPDLTERTAQSKDKLFALLNGPLQTQLTGQIDADKAPKPSFEKQVEAAEKISDVGRRDQMLVFAVTGSGSRDQPADTVISVIDKISDSGIRGPLLNWFHYFRAQQLITEKNLSEARKFAGKVTELDQRAYLFTRIAEESLKVAEDQTEAREMLNEIADAVSKAPKTIVSARALLALAHLYAKIDMNRGVEELGNAVKTINALESPDFSQQFVMMKIEGKTFGSYASFSTPGFNPENAFREMGKLDFDGSLLQATNFSDKSLRALTTLAVIEPCFSHKKATRN